MCDTNITAASKLSTAQNANKNAPGPTRPMFVINLLTDKTDHLFCIRLSALCPATIMIILTISVYVLLGFLVEVE